MWIPSGIVTNPAANAILCDSGPLPAGVRTVQVILAATIAAAVELQYRNAANDVTIKTQVIAVPAFGTIFSPLFIQDIDMALNERFRVTNILALVGAVSCSLNFTS